MEFDPIIALILAVIVGLFSYVYYLHTQKAPSLPDLSTLAPLYEADLFTSPLSEKDAYLTAKREQLRKHDRPEDSQSVSDVDADGRRLLMGLLLKRTIGLLDRSMKVNAEIVNVRALQNGHLLTQAQVDEIQAGIRAIEQEHKDVRVEAEILKPGWSQAIFAQAHDMTLGLQQRKEQRRREEEKGREDPPEPRERIVAAPTKSREEQRREEEERARAARVAEENYRRLIAEEERREKQTKKGSSKGK